jgi:uncharacterized membrane protein YeiH
VIDMEPANLLVMALDLIGTFVFAISGAMLGTDREWTYSGSLFSLS